MPSHSHLFHYKIRVNNNNSNLAGQIGGGEMGDKRGINNVDHPLMLRIT